MPPALPASAVRDVYLLGGSCRLASHVTIGPVTFPGTEGISADVAVIGVGGVSSKADFTTTNLQEAQMMAQMIESAQRTIVVIHSSKFGRGAFAHIVRLDAVELLITDQMPEPELRDALAAAEAEIVVAAGLSRSKPAAAMMPPRVINTHRSWYRIAAWSGPFLPATFGSTRV